MNLIKALRHSTFEHNGREKRRKHSSTIRQFVRLKILILIYNPREARRKKKKSHIRGFLSSWIRLSFDLSEWDTLVVWTASPLSSSYPRSFSLLVCLRAVVLIEHLIFGSKEKELKSIANVVGMRVGGLNQLILKDKLARVERFETCRWWRSWEQEKDDVGIKTQHSIFPKSFTVCTAIKLKQIVTIKCREKWKNSIYLKSKCLMACRVIISRSVRLHYNFIFMCILIGFRFVFHSVTHSPAHFFTRSARLFHFAIRACCILNLRAMEKLALVLSKR